ncbi:ago [Drosophila busckii]|uniref:Ago n=1 Tax=Drosophila busckii TaxID=30019 RepID=A0A0M4EHF5_DROBS|nr:F-box/WD repeat-containing protein 7 [Drosophila busckii]ALC44015.1 ago [Drosophila busckii]
MERGCSLVNSVCASVEQAQRKSKRQSKASQVHGAKRESKSGNILTKSMSKLREDVEDCVSSNSQHGFAVVLDDESSTETTGVLETYEISSSNSLPNSTPAVTAATAATVNSLGMGVVVVPVDDSSSTDTINGNVSGNERTQSVASEGSSVNNVFFDENENENDNEPPVVCLINDEYDDDEELEQVEEEEEEEEVEEEEDDDDDTDSVAQSMALDCPNTSQLNTDSVIMNADGSKVFIETPVVDEPQSQSHVHVISTAANQLELPAGGKPKRLSDEFDAEARAQAQEQQQSNRVVKSEAACEVVGKDTIVGVASSSLHDRQMSVRLKQMSLTANAAEAATSSSNASSTSTAKPLSKADIESMDLIERRDFETEQRLTGGIILGHSSLINKNRLNLNLINRPAGTAASVGASATTAGGVSSSSDDWPSSSSSNSRAFNSDSKCTYKDLSTTPTSSRKFTNSRLSKSTAKLNLGASLANSSSSSSSTSSTAPCPQHSSNCNSNANAKQSTVIVEPSTSSAHSKASGSSTAAATTSYNSVASQTIQEEEQEKGCSRTSVVSVATATSAAADVDAQPSTSSTSTTSARCHYAAAAMAKPIVARQVNASAQTQERFLARSGLAAGNVVRPRRRVEATRNPETNAIVLEVVVEDGNNNNGNGNNNGNSNANGNGNSNVNGNANGDAAVLDPSEFNADDPWNNCDEENNCSDVEEICTCQNSMLGNSHCGSNASINEGHDMDATDSSYLPNGDESHSLSTAALDCSQSQQQQQPLQRKRKYNDGRLLDGDHAMGAASSIGGNAAGGQLGAGDNSRKRIAYDYASTPRSAPSSNLMLSLTPTGAGMGMGLGVAGSSPAIGRRTPRASATPELQHWLQQFQRWNHTERLVAVDRLIEHCDPSQVRHMMNVIEPQFQRDFISLLPRETALFVLSYLEPKDLLRAAQTCRSWRFLCDDNLLWKEKCRKAQILTESSRSDRPRRGRDGNMPPISSPWKAAYMRQHIIEMNWRSRPVRRPKVLKGHDDHVITCLQFSGNRIVSGSDDNTLKVWSAVNGKCLRTLVGHTGGVWSSQMSGNIIISGSTDRTLKVWDMDSGACVHTLQGHTSTVRCMHLHGNKVVSGSRDATLRVWDIDQGSCLHVLVGHLAAVRCVQYDGKLIVSGAYDYMVKIWHPERQECLHTLQGHTNRVYSLQFDGVHVVSGSLDTSIRVWDVETGNCKHTLMGHQSLTSGMELRQNILVSGNADSTVKVWDITTGQCLQTLSGPNKHQSAVTCLQFNSRFVVTSSDDGTVKLWDVKTGEFIRNLVALDSGGSGGVVWRIRANDTKLICAVGSRNGTEETKLMVLDFDVEGACVKCS